MWIVVTPNNLDKCQVTSIPVVFQTFLSVHLVVQWDHEDYLFIFCLIKLNINTNVILSILDLPSTLHSNHDTITPIKEIEDLYGEQWGSLHSDYPVLETVTSTLHYMYSIFRGYKYFTVVIQVNK